MNNLRGGVDQESEETEVAQFSSPGITHKTRKRNKAGERQRILRQVQGKYFYKTDQDNTSTSIQTPAPEENGRAGGRTFLMGVKRGRPI